MRTNIQRPVTYNQSEENFAQQLPPPVAIAQEEIHFQQDRNKAMAGFNPQAHNHPQQLQQNPHEGVGPNPYTYQNPQQQNPYEQQPPHVIQDGNMLYIDGAPQQVIIVNQGGGKGVAKRQQASWTRQDRIGCCCVSVHNDCYCCNVFCMNSFCRSIQHLNLCCYCHNQDCIRCCVHDICRTCCLEKAFCECVLECCKHMPLCLLFECLKNNGCGECLCNCIQNCNICEMVNGCECGCVGQIMGGICGILCCFFK